MTRFKTIDCPTDFSDIADQALRYTHALARLSSGAVHGVHAVDVGFATTGIADGVYVSTAELHASLDSLKEHAQKELDKYVRLEHFRGVDVTPHLRVGPAPEEIAAVV